LEKTSEIIKSNCQAISTMPAKPCPELAQTARSKAGDMGNGEPRRF